MVITNTHDRNMAENITPMIESPEITRAEASFVEASAPFAVPEAVPVGLGPPELAPAPDPLGAAVGAGVWRGEDTVARAA